MCGRYVSVSKVLAIEKRFQVKAEHPELYIPNVNIGPGQTGPIITSEEPGLLQFSHFGLIPSWSKKKMYLFNARAEGDHNQENSTQYHGSMGIVSKPSFRNLIRKKRCLIAADAFLEGPEKEKLSKPFVVYLKNKQRPFAFAGLYDDWIDQETGEVYRSHSIITVWANPLMQKIGHHRSPVILDPSQEKLWLDTELPLADVTSMLHPYPAEEMNAYPVKPDIKKPGANELSLLEPIGQRLQPEYEYEIYEELKLEGMGMTTARRRKLDL